MNNDLISREALLKAMEKERQYLLERGQTGAEHILVHHCLPLIDNAPAVYDNPYSDGREDGYIEGYEEAKRESERPQGEWVESKNGSIKCNQCGCEIVYSYLIGNKPDFPKFCCDCGAKMRKGNAE